jgi:hypothetical protein
MPIYHVTHAGAMKTTVNPLEPRYAHTSQIMAVHEEGMDTNPLLAKDRDSPIVNLILRGPMTKEHAKAIIDLWYQLREGR